MVADSPYNVQDSVLSLRAGAVIGAVGAQLMLGLLWILWPLSLYDPTRTLAHLGSAVAGFCPLECGHLPPPTLGYAVHMLIGTLLGMLCAGSLQRIPVRGLVSIGIFYGVLLWVAGGILSGPLLGEAVRSDVRSWPWLLATLLYGAVQSGAAILAERLRPRRKEIVQLD